MLQSLLGSYWLVNSLAAIVPSVVLIFKQCFIFKKVHCLCTKYAFDSNKHLCVCFQMLSSE